jgi:hypothetical protein
MLGMFPPVCQFGVPPTKLRPSWPLNVGEAAHVSTRSEPTWGHLREAGYGAAYTLTGGARLGSDCSGIADSMMFSMSMDLSGEFHLPGAATEEMNSSALETVSESSR